MQTASGLGMTTCTVNGLLSLYFFPFCDISKLLNPSYWLSCQLFTFSALDFPGVLKNQFSELLVLEPFSYFPGTLFIVCAGQFCSYFQVLTCEVTDT